MSTGEARIVQQGFRGYDGPRRGPRAAIKSLFLNTMERTLGARRSVWAKLLPILTIAIAFLPAVVIVGIIALFPIGAEEIVPAFDEYYGLVGISLLIFSALVSPEVLCPDRRSGVISLYLSSPLTPVTYLIGKALGVFAVTGLITLVPPLVLLFGVAMQGAGPDGFGNFMLTVSRMLAAGIILSVYYGLISLAVSSLTDRKAFASAGMIMLLLATQISVGILINGLEMPDWLSLFDIFSVPFILVQRIFDSPREYAEVSAWLYAAASLVWAGAAAGVLYLRYRRTGLSR